MLVIGSFMGLYNSMPDYPSNLGFFVSVSFFASIVFSSIFLTVRELYFFVHYSSFCTACQAEWFFEDDVDFHLL
jgi:hypothetical protein